MSLFTLDLGPHHRALLEAHRQRLGARSLASAVRMLIDPPLPEEEVGRIMRELSEWSLDAGAEQLGKAITHAVGGRVPHTATKDQIRNERSAALPLGAATPSPGSRLKKR